MKLLAYLSKMVDCFNDGFIANEERVFFLGITNSFVKNDVCLYTWCQYCLIGLFSSNRNVKCLSYDLIATRTSGNQFHTLLSNRAIYLTKFG